MRCDTGLWQNFCGQTPRSVRRNPVLFLQFILELNTEALESVVQPAVPFSFVNVRTGASHRADPYPTTGTAGKKQVAMPVVDVRILEARAATSDTVIEANRIAYEASRVGGVTGSAHKWCTAAGISEDELRDRHDYVRNEEVIVHTFWHCPERLKVHDTITTQIKADAAGPRPCTSQRETPTVANSRAARRNRTPTRTIVRQKQLA